MTDGGGLVAAAPGSTALSAENDGSCFAAVRQVPSFVWWFCHMSVL